MSFNQFPTRFGKYIVLDRISVGGMAEVYRAKEIRESGITRLVALKRMLDAMASDATMTPMFVDEAKLAAQLVHPNIAQTLELGRIDDALYIAMELVWGRDLKSIIKACKARHYPIPPGVAAYVVAKAAEALDFAHNAPGPDGKPMKLVHRDVSPHNLMLDYDGEVKVIDFGVAKAEAKSSETMAGVIKGKFSYMAPEQVIGSPVDARTDIFALGIVLYELLSGERLYDGSSAFSIFDQVVNQPAPRLGNVVQVAPALDEIVARCLAKRPEERFETASQLADALSPLQIQERSIVGPREAKQLVKTLFPDDEAEMREKLQRYQAIRDVDCVNARAAATRRPTGQSQIFAISDASPFAEPGTQGHSLPTALYSSVPTGPLEALTPPANPSLDPRSVPLARRTTGRSTDEIETPPPRRGLAVTIGIVALVLGVVTVIAQLKNVSPLALVQSALDMATSSSLLHPNRHPPAAAPLTATEVRLPPLPVVTTSQLPPRPQVGSLEPPAPASGTVAPAPPAPVPSTPAPAPPAPAPAPPPTRSPDPPRPSGGKRPAAAAKSSAPAAGKDNNFGYVSIGAKGPGNSKVFVDGREIGYSPVLNYKLKVGNHSVKVIPYKDELPGKPVTQSFSVTKENSPGSPLRLVIDLN